MTMIIQNGPKTATITRAPNGYRVGAFVYERPGQALAAARIAVGICPCCLRAGHTSQACPELRREIRK